MAGFELIGKEEQNAVNLVFKNGGVLCRLGQEKLRKNHRFFTLEFEQAMAKWLKVKHVLAVTSGSAALKIALKAMRVGPKDEVIVPTFTFPATAAAVADCGATPVLVNINETLNMDPVELEKAITPRTKVIIPVHMLGVPCQMDEIMRIAKKHKLLVLEDSCEALGAKWKKEYTGNIGHIAAFSLEISKSITTGEGGLVVTNDKALYQLANEFHDHGHQNNPKLERGHDSARHYGLNFRFTELQSALGLAQIAKLDYILKKNKEHYLFLESQLKKIPDITFRTIPENSTPTYEALIFYLPTAKQAKIFVEKMTENGLGTAKTPGAFEWHFAGFWHFIFKEFGYTKKQLWTKCLPSYEILARTIALPIMVKTTKKDLEKTAKTLQKIAATVL